MTSRSWLRVLLCAGAVATAASRAAAGDLSVVLRDQRGAPVTDAVVTVEEPQGHAPAHYDQPLRMSQHDLSYAPYVLVVPVGAEVRFGNEDKVRHHVYSFSKTKRFELKLFGHDETRSVRFDKPGVVALGCNIHDRMSAYIKVVDAPYAERTDASGRAVFRGLAAGPVQVRVWHPRLRAANNELHASVEVPKTGQSERDFSAQVPAAPDASGL